MYPDPTTALPLPPRPDLEQYRKRAKDLVKACHSHEADGIRHWAVEWLDTLAHLTGDSDTERRREQVRRYAGEVADFARARLSGGPRQCGLSDAQFVLARAHGFASWPVMVKHFDGLARASSPVSAFEAAVDAIVGGDQATLAYLLREHPELIRARSTREHQATLLHYVSANGVEGYRQKTPANAVTIARLLLDRGAEVDAAADVYGGGCTTLGLVATSVHPEKAGVQRELIDVLLDHGARMDGPAPAGNRQTLVRACFANGQPGAAHYLASRGAPLDLPGAAGVGRVDVVKTFFYEDRDVGVRATPAQIEEAFALACAFGQTEVADYLLGTGIDVNTELSHHGRGHAALHTAAYRGHVDVVKVLLRRGAHVDVVDKEWGTTPLVWALTGWNDRPGTDPARYRSIVVQLVAAGATVTPDLLDWENARADPGMLAALRGSGLQ
jgi:hypothetical protein